MDNGPGWLPDPEDEAQERYWSGSAWTDRVRPAGRSRSLHLPEHVPELQRALAAATADIDEVEDRLSTLFERTDDGPPKSTPRAPAAQVRHDPVDDDDAFRDADAEAAEGQTGSEDEVEPAPIHPEFADPSGDGGDDEDLAELDAALAAEEPEEAEETGQPRRRLFRRRS